MNSPMLPIVSTMQLLISVTTIEEADIALENGADIIDLKDPNRGALGALPISAIQAIVTHVKNKTQGSSKLTSATIGDLPMQADLLLKHVALLVTTGVDIIKIGFFESYFCSVGQSPGGSSHGGILFFFNYFSCNGFFSQ